MELPMPVRHLKVRDLLINEGYLNYLSQEELDTVLENAKFLKSLSRWFHNSEGIPKWFSKRIRAKLKRLENI